MVNLKGLFLEMNPLHQTPDPWRSEATASAGNELICNVSDKAPSRPCPLQALNLRCLRGNEFLHLSVWNPAPVTGASRPDPGPGSSRVYLARPPFPAPGTSLPSFMGRVRRAPQTNTTHHQSETGRATQPHNHLSRHTYIPTYIVTLTHHQLHSAAQSCSVTQTVSFQA